MNPDHLRQIHRRLRESHQQLFALQGDMIASLREALTAIQRTQDEMVKLFQADNDLEDDIEQP